MAREKVYSSCEAAVADISDGATVLIGGFAGCGTPRGLIDALARQGAKGLTCVFSPGVTADSPESSGLDRLVANGQIEKLISALPFGPNSGGAVCESWQAGQLEIEVVPQGTLAERLRAAGAGLGGVFIPTGAGTRFAEGKETRRFPQTFPGHDCLFELPLAADFAFFRAEAADTLGNLVYRGSGRNWGPMMAMAATVSIAEADRICQPGGIDPEVIISSGIFVNRVVQTPEF